MKTTLLLLVCFAFHSIGMTQSSNAIGKIVYYEGKVELGKPAHFEKAKIDMPVSRGEIIKVYADGMAEVVWDNGVKSMVGPESTTPVSELFAGASSDIKSRAEESKLNFTGLFNSSPASKNAQEGGIRREEQEERKKPAKDEVYWKSDEEMFFDEAFALYEAEEYAQAIPALHAFINQKPNDQYVKYAHIALGYSYVMTNNTIAAKDIFDRFIIEFPDDELAENAKEMSEKLK